MARYRFTAYKNDTQPRYMVVLGDAAGIIDCQRLDPAERAGSTAQGRAPIGARERGAGIIPPERKPVLIY
jgi:hypothetical protein